MTLKSSVVSFQSLEPLQPRWPQRPLQPQWPLQPQKPYFTKELRGTDGWIIPVTKMTNTVPFLLNESSKIQIFTDNLYSIYQRLLRPADVIFLKTKKICQKFIISGSQNYFQTRFYLHISICQSQFIKHSSIWDTLYYGSNKSTGKKLAKRTAGMLILFCYWQNCSKSSCQNSAKNLAEQPTLEKEWKKNLACSSEWSWNFLKQIESLIFFLCSGGG